MSDHDAVRFEAQISLGKQEVEKKRKIFQFHKADKDGIIFEIHEFSETFFEQNQYDRTIHDNWHLFKTTIVDAIDKFVPSKIIKPNKDFPWINQFIK